MSHLAPTSISGHIALLSFPSTPASPQIDSAGELALRVTRLSTLALRLVSTDPGSLILKGKECYDE